MTGSKHLCKHLCGTTMLKNAFFCYIYDIFQECAGGLAGFEGISGLAISGLEYFEN
jgi:hypothetical protein